MTTHDDSGEALWTEWQIARASRSAAESMVRTARHELQRARALGLGAVPAAEHLLMALEARLYALTGEEEAARERYQRVLEDDGIQAA